MATQPEKGQTVLMKGYIYEITGFGKAGRVELTRKEGQDTPKRAYTVMASDLVPCAHKNADLTMPGWGPVQPEEG